ncbi:hypothetical protein L1049_017256 [Liquidambar formosana]|uniref:Uncharacterized protein n=1 Tax=Liquidambar formosana TaxID=63359 RepID=A0AAP0X3L6_LIQFO
MEMGISSIMLIKQKLEFFDILKAALVIPCKNANFIVFTFFSSLPFFCFMVLYETFLQTTLVETSKVLTVLPGLYNYIWVISTFITRRLTWDFSLQLIRLGLLYLVPLHLLELFNVIVTVDLGSRIYTGENPITLREMIHKSVDKAWLKGSFITSVYVLFLSTCTLLGLIWMLTSYTIFSGTFIYDLFFMVVYGAAFAILLTKYLEWSAVWNMSIVVSILEKRYGVEAFAVSEYLVRGNEQRGLFLMLVFFAWGIVLRLPCLYGECNEIGSKIVPQITLFCLGNVMKWVVCVVYFYDCKKRILEKIDEEGEEFRAVDEEEGREKLREKADDEV